MGGKCTCPSRRDQASQTQEVEAAWWEAEEATAAELRWRRSVHRIIFLLRIRQLWASELRARRHHARLHTLVVIYKPLFRHLRRVKGKLVYHDDSL